jgi:hypothetical protein
MNPNPFVSFAPGQKDFIKVYYYSNKGIYDVIRPIANYRTYYGNNVLRHSEAQGNLVNVIMNSGVCVLGRAFFYITIITMLGLLVYKYNNPEDSKHLTIVMNTLAIILVSMTFLLNLPLFVRSIPAFTILFIMINYDKL